MVRQHRPQRGTRKDSAGSSAKPKEEFEPYTLQVRRVARVMAGGRRFSFQVTIVVGDKKGSVGLGVRKGRDVASAVEKATRAAKKDIVRVPLVGGTIPREIEAKYSSARLILRPARKGRGIIAGGSVRAVCASAGIQDISAKIISRSSNPLNNARATIEAFRMLAERVAVRKAIRKEKPREKEPEKGEESVLPSSAQET